MHKIKSQQKNWRKVKLGELGKVITGKTPSTFEPENFNGPYPFITIPDFKNQRYIITTERTLSEKGANTMKNLKLPRNSVMLSCLATVGESGITIKESFTNQQINSLVCDAEKISPIFLYYEFKYIKPALEGIGSGGSVYTNISKDKFSNIEIFIPKDVKEQKRIAGILSVFDDKIELNSKINQTLEQMARAIFKEWFVKFRFPGYKKIKMVDSELGKIPKGWEVKSLGDGIFTKIISNGIDKFNGEKIYLATADVSDKDITNSEMKISYNKRPSRADMQPLINSVWFAKMINTYKILFFFNQNEEDLQKYILSTGFMGIKCNKGLEFFIYIFISSKKFHLIKDTLVQGAVQEALTLGNIKRLKILIPTVEILAKFNQAVKPMFREIYKNKSENQKLAALRDLLLPKLINGEIRI